MAPPPMIINTDESGHAEASSAAAASCVTTIVEAPMTSAFGSPNSMVHLGAPPPPPPPTQQRLVELTQPDFALSMSPIKRRKKK